MRKNFILLLCSIIIILNSSGCDFKDIDKRVFIVAVGIDGNQGNPDLITMSFKAAMPGSVGEGSGTGSNSQGGNTHIYTVTGSSVSNILRTLKGQTSMEPDFSHMKIIVYGRDYAGRHDISSIEEFFIRRRDFQDMAWVCLGAPTAKEVLSVTPNEEKVPGNGLFLKFGQGTDSPYAVKTKSYELYNDIITPGCTPVCSIMQLKEGNIIMNEAALFSEGKLALILSKEETQLLNLLKDRIKFGTFSIIRKEEKKPTSISVDNGKSKINVSKAKDGGGITCTIDIKIEGSLEEINLFTGKATELSPEFEEALKKQVMTLLNKFSNNNLDPLRLEMRYWSNTLEFIPTKVWLTDMIPNINYVINPKIDIIHTGVIEEK
ncbi:Ger(x)C family spore germination protein [Clostridium omnivorum]|uniref:Ger(X)C family spore germination protein n=1 Tax=Clostridium omnivorum TaxID=1604902 RepID=A0ABQ5N449_9CLOT|nr:Ger(x)C family spore germination C-terminal domain-containing protein [Clostridium sp. E14]GLC29983.1 hypothetical protein bsdE14_13930 [Clostridium sp. E14]